MPRPSRNPIINTEASFPQRQAGATEVVAGPVSSFVQPEDNDLLALTEALGKVHAPLARMQERDDDRARQDAIIAAKAQAARAADPANADVSVVTAATPPAWRREAELAFHEGIGARLGVNAQNDYLDSYKEESRDPAFNFETHAAEFRAKHLQGLNAPLAIGAGKHIDEAIAQARGDYRQVQEKRFVESRNANLQTRLSGIAPDADPYRRLLDFQEIAASHVKQGGTRAEAATAMLDQIDALSVKLGGRKDLYDVFDMEVPGIGKRLGDLAGLTEKVERAKVQAETQLKHTLRDTTQVARAEQITRIDKMLEDGTAVRMGEEGFATYLKQFMSTDGTGAFDAEGYATRMHAFRKSLAFEHDKATKAALLAAGQGHLITNPADAKKVIGEALDKAGVMETLTGALTNPQADPDAFSRATNAIISIHQSTGVAFGDERLKNLVESVKQAIPKDGDAASPKFQGIAKLYAAMERSSKPLLNTYFDNDTRAIFSTYNRLTSEGQVASNTALRQAYAVVDPDNIKAAEERMKDPAFASKLHGEVRSTMRGWFGGGNTAFIGRYVPFGSKPDLGNLEAATQREVLEYKKMNPYATNDEMIAHGEQWVEANHFYEPTSGKFLQVPPAYNNPTGQDAISNYLAVVKQNNPNVRPELVPKGNGYYDLVFYQGGVPEKAADNVRIEQMLALRTAQKTFTDDELGRVKDIRMKIEAGTATPEDLRNSEHILSKARSTNLWPASLQRKAEELSVKAAQAKTLTAMEPALRTAVGRSEFNASAAVKPKGAQTTQVAGQFFAAGDLTGALAAMGEGVATVVYKDSAGTPTIGLGYNLTANATTLSDDFRKAGIPVEQIEDIKAGKRHITVDQAMRLHAAVKPRYESIAKAAVEERYPGEWPKLGDNVKAVLTDIAYQTGNVKQFKDGLSRIFEGDLSGSGLEVKFKNAKTQQYQQDSRRHTLRAAMLSSSTYFQTLLTHASKQPANALQSRAVAGTGGS